MKQSAAHVDKERPAADMFELETHEKGGEGSDLRHGRELSGAALHTLD